MCSLTTTEVRTTLYELKQRVGQNKTAFIKKRSRSKEK